MRLPHDLPHAPTAKLLIIASVRANLRNAYENLAACQAARAGAQSSWSMYEQLQGFVKDGETVEFDPARRDEILRSYDQQIDQLRQIVERWEQALDQALMMKETTC